MKDAKKLLSSLKDRGEVWSEVRCEATVYRLVSILDGDDRVIGFGGARLKMDLEDMIQHPCLGCGHCAIFDYELENIEKKQDTVRNAAEHAGTEALKVGAYEIYQEIVAKVFAAKAAVDA